MSKPKGKIPHKYENMEINSKTHNHILPGYIKKKLVDPLESYDAENTFSQTFDGLFTNNDPLYEEAKVDKFSLTKVQEILQPKLKLAEDLKLQGEALKNKIIADLVEKKKLAKETEIKKPMNTGPDYVNGKKLPLVTSVDPNTGKGH